MSDVVANVRAEVEEHRKAIGARLRELRKARGLSQEDAAHAVGVAVKTWQNWERGRTAPYDSNWRRIADYFGVEPADIVGTPPSPLGLGAAVDAVQLDRIEQKLDAVLEWIRERAGEELERDLEAQAERANTRSDSSASGARAPGGRVRPA